ncbi:MAG TPA: response regulator transcription factor [Steroidobacteraceae bacterium]|jgi:two-component system OmpR family response regulator|nr:response regulator transcription factor [Steroidobacteraceae bacterium]
MTILLVEDDVELARSLIEHFRDSGYAVQHVGDGEAALNAARSGDYEVVLLDRMLPGVSGLDVVQRLRHEAILTPVIYLTTMGGVDDRVQGLEAGGDDYLVKPFAFAELLARVRVVTRRSANAAPRLLAGSIELDLLHRTAARAGQAIELLPQEFRLLEYMMRHANRVLTRKMLLENVWDIHFDPHTSVVESHISRLRARLNHGFEIDAIQTVRGIGYKLLASN